MTLKCKKCDYQWFPRMENPTVCPKCKSYKWNQDLDGRRNNLNRDDRPQAVLPLAPIPSIDEDDPFPLEYDEHGRLAQFDEHGDPVPYNGDGDDGPNAEDPPF